ncbi:MAG: hypothetical protein JWN40_2187 [Phycisphaerales bacterium]|nr:hypothetical protein [Phycisphaerales bacterium]
MGTLIERYGDWHGRNARNRGDLDVGAAGVISIFSHSKKRGFPRRGRTV